MNTNDHGGNNVFHVGNNSSDGLSCAFIFDTMPDQWGKILPRLFDATLATMKKHVGSSRFQFSCHTSFKTRHARSWKNFLGAHSHDTCKCTVAPTAGNTSGLGTIKKILLIASTKTAGLNDNFKLPFASLAIPSAAALEILPAVSSAILLATDVPVAVLIDRWTKDDLKALGGDKNHKEQKQLLVPLYPRKASTVNLFESSAFDMSIEQPTATASFILWLKCPEEKNDWHLSRGEKFENAAINSQRRSSQLLCNWTVEEDDDWTWPSKDNKADPKTSLPDLCHPRCGVFQDFDPQDLCYPRCATKEHSKTAKTNAPHATHNITTKIVEHSKTVRTDATHDDVTKIPKVVTPKTDLQDCKSWQCWKNPRLARQSQQRPRMTLPRIVSLSWSWRQSTSPSGPRLSTPKKGIQKLRGKCSTKSFLSWQVTNLKQNNSWHNPNQFIFVFIYSIIYNGTNWVEKSKEFFPQGQDKFNKHAHDPNPDNLVVGNVPFDMSKHALSSAKEIAHSVGTCKQAQTDMCCDEKRVHNDELASTHKAKQTFASNVVMETDVKMSPKELHAKVVSIVDPSLVASNTLHYPGQCCCLQG